jgi:hypothetical protein
MLRLFDLNCVTVPPQVNCVTVPPQVTRSQNIGKPNNSEVCVSK